MASKFTQRHYQAIADLFRDNDLELQTAEDSWVGTTWGPSPTDRIIFATRYAQNDVLISQFVKMFKADNPNFKESKFISACQA
jgi:hypothetical protein